MKIILITLFAYVQANTIRQECTLLKGGVGYCTPLKECESLKEIGMIFVEQFCNDERTLFCCDLSDEISTRSTPSDPRSSFIEHSNFQNFDMEACGQKKTSFRIALGNKTALFEFNFGAMIGYQEENDEIRFRCGGSLITTNHVLTAAHCLMNKNGALKSSVAIVRLGEHTISTSPDCNNEGKCADDIQDIPITTEDLVIHKDFNYGGIKNDIALIRLKEPAKIHQNNIDIICLPFNNPEIPERFFVIGFGKTDKNPLNSDVLMKATVTLKTDNDCTFNRLGRVIKIDETQICAGDSVDSCEGDSGSALLRPSFLNNKVRDIQYGIVSYGFSRTCGDNKPGVYTKVYPHLNWILDNL